MTKTSRLLKPPTHRLSPAHLGAAVALIISGLTACSGSSPDRVADETSRRQTNDTTTPADVRGAPTEPTVEQVVVTGQSVGAPPTPNGLPDPTIGPAPQDVATESETALAQLLSEAKAARADRSMDQNRLAGRIRTESQYVQSYRPVPQPSADNERYEELRDPGVKLTTAHPVSTFSIDVDTGAYSNVRRFLNDGRLPPENAVRIEEMINYFAYSDAAPRGDTPFAVSTTVAPTPWNKDTQLLRIGLKGRADAGEKRPASNLVFLVDVSGSMQSQNKLPLLVDSLNLLVQQLNDHDRVSLVVYAGASGVVLPPTAGDDRARIRDALNRLRAGGPTNGAAGIRQAYALAREAFIEDGINRVILATDGDFNVGMADTQKLIDLIERERASGVSLTTLGFGKGNLNDHMMERIADAGNGNYAYIDTLAEARKVLVDEVGSTLHTIASDVKIQVEFNPDTVAEYRLIGYHNRQLARADFNNDRVDAGDIGAGHSIVALYEITPVDSDARRIDPLRYGAREPRVGNISSELAFVRLRYKDPGEATSKLLERVIDADTVVRATRTSDDFRFAAAVAAFGETLRGGTHLGEYALDDVLALAQSAVGQDRHGYRNEFVSLVTRTQRLMDQDTDYLERVATLRD